MPTIFSRIIDGELPARFVWRDERCVAFLSINPLKPGHTLVVPREEIDHWLDLDDEVLAHCVQVARTIGRALERAYSPPKVGLMLAGLEVPHVHFHVVPMWGVRDLDFANAARNPAEEDLEAAAVTVRDALRELGAPHVAE